MIELELLGVEPDSGKLSLNDPEGNRYSLAITDELLAALRRDVPEPVAEPKPVTPREIQAMFRAGKSVDEVAQISALPASALLALEHPITAERRYTANQARSYRQARELGGLTIAELVVSRLIDRGVTADGVAWDAYREAGAPWTLTARYSVADEQVTALWRINSKNQSVTALNDEARWLTETAVPAPSSPWRAHNTPRFAQHDARSLTGNPHAANKTSAEDKTSAADKNLTSTNKHDSAGILRLPQGLPQDRPSDEEVTAREQELHQNGQEPNQDLASEMYEADQQAQDLDIDSMLASLDAQRGKIQAMPDDLCDDDDADAGADLPSGSSAAQHDAQEPDNTKEPEGATILAFPSAHRDSGENSDTADADDGSHTADSPQDSQKNAQKSQPKGAQKGVQKKKRRDRPAMPSWDEIVFGYSKDDHE